jgi:uncharacterized membrane protein (UPF0127 family)
MVRAFRYATPVSLFLSDGVQLECIVAAGFAQRLAGLLGTIEGDVTPAVLAFPKCASLHTFGMRYPLDVAFLGRNGAVLRSERHVPPGMVLSCLDSYLALERPSSGSAWPVLGEQLDIAAILAWIEKIE